MGRVGSPRLVDVAATNSDGSTRPWLTRNVKVLSAVSLAQDTASELMYPLIPILLTTSLGAPAAVVGLVEGVAEGVANTVADPAGKGAECSHGGDLMEDPSSLKGPW